jgi:hypothetical protein
MTMRVRGLLLVGLCLGSIGLSSTLAWCQTGAAQPPDLDARPIGKVVTVTGTVSIEHATAIVVQANLTPSGQTKVGDSVYRGDIIQTRENSTLGVIFLDGTSFNATSNARMELNEFVYDPNGHSNSALLSLTTGTFNIIAGKIARTGDMKVDTPVATMGIRGTSPHIEISPDGTTKFSTLIERK